MVGWIMASQSISLLAQLDLFERSEDSSLRIK